MSSYPNASPGFVAPTSLSNVLFNSGVVAPPYSMASLKGDSFYLANGFKFPTKLTISTINMSLSNFQGKRFIR